MNHEEREADRQRWGQRRLEEARRWALDTIENEGGGLEPDRTTLARLADRFEAPELERALYLGCLVMELLARPKVAKPPGTKASLAPYEFDMLASLIENEDIAGKGSVESRIAAVLGQRIGAYDPPRTLADLWGLGPDANADSISKQLRRHRRRAKAP